jgi:hypothetical protein
MTAAGFNKDATVLAAGGCGEYDHFSGCKGELVLWHAQSGTLLAPPFETGANIADVVFDGDRVTVEMEQPFETEPTLARLDLDVSSWARRACARANRNLSADEWRRYLPDEPPGKTCIFNALPASESH